jgi:hypothetical protein
MPSPPSIGPQRVEFTRLLGGDWQDLADAAGIPSWVRLRFPQGREGSAILDLLESRGDLHNLPGYARILSNPRVDELAEAIGGAASTRRSPNTGIITHLSWHFSDCQWEALYDEVREGADTREMPVTAWNSRSAAEHIDIDFVVHDAWLVMTDKIDEGTVEERLRLRKRGQVGHLIIYVVGPRWKAADAKIAEWLGNGRPTGVSLAGVRRPEDLRIKMSAAILAAARRIRGPYRDNDRDDLRGPSVDGFS